MMTEAEASRRKASEPGPRSDRSGPRASEAPASSRTPSSTARTHKPSVPPPAIPDDEDQKPDPSFQDDAQDDAPNGQGVFPYD
jgi:hypothetical protein